LALQNYEMAYEVLPPGTVNGSGPILNLAQQNQYHVSWILAILPQLELSNVYHHFDFREGVYAQRNRAVQQRKLPVLLCPSSGVGGSYVGCYASREVPIDRDNDGVLFLNSSVRLEDITDGCSNTIAVGETSRGATVWGWTSGTRDTLRNAGTPPNSPLSAVPNAPEAFEDFSRTLGIDQFESTLDKGEERSQQDLSDPKLLLVGGFGSSHNTGAQFAFCDGSVRFLHDGIDASVFSQLGSRAGGEMPGDF
jgi:prepilin-type processing-associated H-X9-DG protein